MQRRSAQFLGGQQLVGTERHGQELLEGHDGVLAELVVHEDGSAGLLNKNQISQRKAHPSSDGLELHIRSGKTQDLLHRRTRG